MPLSKNKNLTDYVCPDCENIECECWEDEDEICGYECLGCGNVQDDPGLGLRCNRCYGGCLDPIYF